MFKRKAFLHWCALSFPCLPQSWVLNDFEGIPARVWISWSSRKQKVTCKISCECMMIFSLRLHPHDIAHHMHSSEYQQVTENNLRCVIININVCLYSTKKPPWRKMRRQKLMEKPTKPNNTDGCHRVMDISSVSHQLS
jgi:hypothetical protein